MHNISSINVRRKEIEKYYCKFLIPGNLEEDNI